jgi:hypothetical protein
VIRKIEFPIIGCYLLKCSLAAIYTPSLAFKSLIYDPIGKMFLIIL